MASSPTVRAPRSGTPANNGHRPDQVAGIAPPRRRVRMPELVVGVLVMTVFALGAVLWHLSAVDKSPALAVVGNVERGQTLSATDVRVVYVSSDGALARLREHVASAQPEPVESVRNARPLRAAFHSERTLRDRVVFRHGGLTHGYDCPVVADRKCEV